MPNQVTKISDIIDPEVMADMISAKIPNKIVIAPFAKVDTTLTGVPGDTITVPQYAYIGDAVDVAEGVAAETVKLAASTAKATVKKAMKAVELTDEAVTATLSAKLTIRLLRQLLQRLTMMQWMHFRPHSLYMTVQAQLSSTIRLLKLLTFSMKRQTQTRLCL